MKHITLIAAIAMLFLTNVSEAADVTVDYRSLFHVAGAGMISTTLNTMAVEYDIPEKDRNILAFSAGAGATLYKEFFMDASPDYGDIFFGLVGSYGGIPISEKYFILPSERGVAIGGRW